MERFNGLILMESKELINLVILDLGYGVFGVIFGRFWR